MSSGLDGMARRAGRGLYHLWLRAVDPRRLAEMAGERTVFNHLRARGFLAGFEGKKILEIGPKHGEDSMLLATLDPGTLVLVDLPEKREQVNEWLPRVASRCKTVFVEGDILGLASAEDARLGRFDLIWCLGVLYHNAEQFRLLRRLFELTSVDGRIVLESATTRNARLADLNVVEVHWPATYRNVRTVTHLPSRQALKSWLEMAGFAEVEIWNLYSRQLGRHRAVVTGKKTADSKPYVGYASQAGDR
jgi:2-polyprenyl-3-methyl-5-hydroxy-6-metoxy-1,4-benzoquinol methylase